MRIDGGESDGSGSDEEWIIVDIKIHLENSRFRSYVFMQSFRDSKERRAHCQVR